jgi:hypothetical protein
MWDGDTGKSSLGLFSCNGPKNCLKVSPIQSQTTSLKLNLLH